MGYTGTTNYGFQKPAKENAFTVDDLNNALDKIDETIKNNNDDINENINQGINELDNNLINDINLNVDFEDNLTVELVKKDNSKISKSVTLPIPSSPFDYVIASRQFGGGVNVKTISGWDAEYNNIHITTINSNGNIYYNDDNKTYLFRNIISLISPSSGNTWYPYYCDISSLNMKNTFQTLLDKYLDTITENWIIPDGSYDLIFQVSLTANLFYYATTTPIVKATLTKENNNYTIEVTQIPTKMSYVNNRTPPWNTFNQIYFILIAFNGVSCIFD